MAVCRIGQLLIDGIAGTFESFRFYNGEHAADVETKAHIAIAPVALGLANEVALGYTRAVGEHELKNVATGFHINTQ